MRPVYKVTGKLADDEQAWLTHAPWCCPDIRDIAELVRYFVHIPRLNVL